MTRADKGGDITERERKAMAGENKTLGECGQWYIRLGTNRFSGAG